MGAQCKGSVDNREILIYKQGRGTSRESFFGPIAMQEMFKFHVHWRHNSQMYVDELPAASMVEVVDYFNDHKRPDVSLVRVELVGPDEGGLREPARSPNLPFGPLIARRRLDIDENAR